MTGGLTLLTVEIAAILGYAEAYGDSAHVLPLARLLAACEKALELDDDGLADAALAEIADERLRAWLMYRFLLHIGGKKSKLRKPVSYKIGWSKDNQKLRPKNAY